ncbi:MAG: hypothetical protein QM723_13745 [Myxococcaceae bacterium]
MIRRALFTLTMFAALVAFPAEARFGKSGGGGHSSGGHSSGGSSSHSSSSHSASPIGGSNGNGVHYSGGYGYGGGYGYYQPHWYSGFYYGSFVPYYGYGWGYPAYRSYGYGEVVGSAPAQAEDPPLRVVAGAEAQGYLSGFTLGVNAAVEGVRWGFNVNAQNMAIRKDDGTPGFDNLQQVNAHLTFAPLVGQYGRIRLEGGIDSVFAPDLIVLGPTVGVSGVWWVGGPIALEGSIMYTPWPFTQVDAKAGLGVGLGAVGLRAGWRFQMLNDQGRVDGVSHTDVYNGPYVGASVVF